MRENRTYGSEGGGIQKWLLPTPIIACAVISGWPAVAPRRGINGDMSPIILTNLLVSCSLWKHVG